MVKRPTSSQLRAFNEVAVAESFSKAAKALGVSQPAVTAQVRALEDAYDVRLFERTGSGAHLTQIGRRLFRRTSVLRDTEREAADILRSAQALEEGQLSIASGGPGPAMKLVAKYRKLYPGVSIQIEFGDWQDVVDAVRDRKADIGILTEAPRGEVFDCFPFVYQRIVALVPAAHPLATQKELSLAQLEHEPVLFRTDNSLTQRTVGQKLKSMGLKLRPFMVLQARGAVYEACAQGLGIGFMFDAASTRVDSVVRVPIKELDEKYSEDVFCLSAQRNLRTTQAFFEMVSR